MTWESKYKAVGIEPFINNILALCKDHEAEAFVWAAGNTAAEDYQELEGFALHNNSARINQKFPVLAVIPRTEDTPPTDDEKRVDEKFEIVVQIEIVFANTDDANAIGKRLMRYARAVRAMIFSATKEEIARGLPDGTWGMLKVIVSPTTYADLFNDKTTQYKKTATTIVTITLTEA